MKLLQIIMLISSAAIWKIVAESKECVSPQYIKLHSTGLIQCSFQEDVFGVLWYNSTDHFHDAALLSLEKSVKKGKRFDSGEFDIHPNGSLIINNVSMIHEGTYTVIKVDSPTSKTISYDVSVSVIAETFSRVPIISKCDTTVELCFQMLDPHSGVFCTVRDARPVIPLNWMVRTIDGDRNMSSHFSVTEETHPFATSRVSTSNPFVYSTMLTLLVCKAEGPPDILEDSESLVLLQNNDKTLIDVKSQKIYAKRDSVLELKCSGELIAYLVWQVKVSSETVFKNVIYAMYVGDNFTYIHDKDYKLKEISSILVENVREHHEGTYRCFSGSGFEDDVILYDLVVFVQPNPLYLEVDGCNHRQNCVLEVEPEGTLTCSVKRIRPQVELDFQTVFEPVGDDISFHDKTITVRDNQNTFDVLLASKYRCIGAAGSRFTVECKVLETNIDELLLSTKFDLILLQGAEPTTEESFSSDQHNYWIIVIVTAVVLISLVLCGLLIVKVRGRRNILRRRNLYEHRITTSVETANASNLSNDDKREGLPKKQYQATSEEVIPMMTKSYVPGNRDMFISELKAKYQDLYAAVQPIPYIRDRLCCVDRIFVEGGIEYLVAKGKLEGQGTWEKLSTYYNILDDDRVKSTRRIIEGEPGYGKSTLTLQLSYDWCNKIQVSYLKDIDILILLRLRQLGGVTSVYRAIKQFLLPKDSKLTESDVKDIISECSSVLVILDGYDEYPDRDSDSDSDVIDIIRRNMFQRFEVILTTRLSYLPKNYPAITKRLKLTGFDDNARDQYIRKAVVVDDVEAAEKIKQRLKKNAVLGDLCQVPLFFVMFAHMSHESETFQKFNSVTSFFRYIISCFHSHMKNKMKDENVRKYDLFETNHRELDNLAFEGLNKKHQRIVWSKGDMCGRLGKDFYDQYVRIGILVEEEVLDISDDHTSISREHIPYKTEVRFYHKLFCEWYAAHHLSEYASRDDVTFDRRKEPETLHYLHDKNFDERNDILESQTDHYLKYLDPFDLQYVYRFTCGLNPVAAEKIIGYLKTREDAKKFPILCILEKSGKVEDVLGDVEDICSHQIYIYDDDSLLLQRSTIQLLEIALASKISISWMYLSNCYSRVDLSCGNHLQLKSNLFIPVLTTLKKLSINTQGEGREITAEEFAGILHFSSKCLALKELIFFDCLLPQPVQAEFFSALRSRNVKVNWYQVGSYRLNLQSCRWERHSDGRVMTDEAYQREVDYFEETYGKN